MDEWQWIFK